MPEVTPQRPTYKTQTAKGTLYAYTRVNGRKVTLGRAGTPAALAKLSRLQAEWGAAQHEFERAEATRLTVAEVAERFIQYESARQDSGLITDKTLHAAKTAASAAVFDPEHAMAPASTFGPKSLRAIQTRLRETPCEDRSVGWLLPGHRLKTNRPPPEMERDQARKTRKQGESEGRCLSDTTMAEVACRDACLMRPRMFLEQNPNFTNALAHPH